MLNFKNKLSELRKERELTQDELADMLGISRSAICNYEKGIREPSFETIELIADTFNVSVAELVDESRMSKMLKHYDALGGIIDKLIALDAADRARIEERIDIFLESDKYKKED